HRNGQHGNHRHAPLAQKQQDDQRAQDGSKDAFLLQAGDRVFDIDRLIHHHLEMNVGPAQPALHAGALVLDALDHAQGAGAGLTIDGNVHLAPAIDAHDVRLNQAGVLRNGDIAQKDRSIVLDLDGNVAHALGQVEHRVGVEGVIEVAKLGVAGGQEDVELVERVHDIHRRQVASLKLDAI